MPEETPLQRLRRLEAEAANGGPSGNGGVRAGAATAAAGGILLLLTKGKFVLLFLLGKLKFLLLAPKLLPSLGTVSTMLLSIQLYSTRYGWSLAAGMVLLILLHELGHGGAARLLGLKVGAPIFIPFFGAVIALKEQPRSSWVECLVAAAGPAAGLLGAAGCALAWTLADPARGGYWHALARLTAVINLFNLLPAVGLDGDRITQPFQRRHWIAALTALVLVCAASAAVTGRAEGILLLILLAAGVKAWRHLNARPESLLDRLEQAGRYSEEGADTTPRRRDAALALFTGLAAALALLSARLELVAPH